MDEQNNIQITFFFSSFLFFLLLGRLTRSVELVCSTYMLSSLHYSEKSNQPNRGESLGFLGSTMGHDQSTKERRCSVPLVALVRLLADGAIFGSVDA